MEPTLFFLAPVIFVILLLAISAFMNKVNFKMGFRNIFRRKENTALVVAGLMVSTSIIGASFIVGDTMDNMITSMVVESLYEIDLQVGYLDQNQGRGEMDEFSSQRLMENISQIKNVEGVAGLQINRLSIFNPHENLSSPSVSAIGYLPDEFDGDFGDFLANGKRVDESLATGNAVFVNEKCAKEMAIEKGHTIITFSTDGGQVPLEVLEIIDNKEKGNWNGGSGIYLNLETLNGILNNTKKVQSEGQTIYVPTREVSSIVITCKGDYIEGMEYIPGVADEIERIFDLENMTTIAGFALNVPPSSPANDAYYVIGENATLEWAGHEWELALWSEGAWQYESPENVSMVYSHDDERAYFYNGEEWKVQPWSKYAPEILGNKKKVVDDNSEAISALSELFIILGSFSIIAGVVLIINIFTLLAEERKSELGISRAIGMTRKRLRRMFMYEGVIYTILSVLVGVLASIPLAFGIIWAFNSIYAGVDSGGALDIMQYFHYELTSIILSVTIGFFISFITIFLTTFKISRLNIVRAIRDIPEPPPLKKDTKILAAGIIGFILGIILFVSSFPSEMAALFFTGISLMIMGVSAILRRYLNERMVYTAGALIVLVFWSIPFEVPNMTGDMEMFVLSGVFMVSASVIILVFNFDLLISFLNFFVRFFHKSLKPVLKMAIAYPSYSKFKTGLLIFIFTIVIFTITVMSMIVGMNSGNIDTFKTEVSGGMDIIGTTGTFTPLDNISEQINSSSRLDINDFQYVEGFEQGYFQLNSKNLEASGTEKRFFYPLNAMTYGFINNTKFSLNDYDDRFDSEHEVFMEVMSNSTTVILDGWAGSVNQYGPTGTFVAGVGDTIQIYHNGTVYNKTVIGVLDSVILNGVFINQKTLTEDFNVTGKRFFLVDLKPGVDIHETALDLERLLLPYQFQTMEIGNAIDELFEAQDSIFNLFNAFLGLGLIIGIAGLGIITIRAVYERRQQIGMLRAIGFKRSWVISAFAVEAGMISLIGIIIGIALGIIIGANIWWTQFRPDGYVFLIPWGDILLYAGIAFVVTLLSTIPPARTAAKIAPAEALRFE